MAELRPAAASVARMGADAARRSVVLLDAMAGRQAGEVVPFHRPSSTTPFARADDVYVLYALEDTDVHRLAGLLVGGVLQLDFAEMPAGGGA